MVEPKSLVAVADMSPFSLLQFAPDWSDTPPSQSYGPDHSIPRCEAANDYLMQPAQERYTATDRAGRRLCGIRVQPRSLSSVPRELHYQ